MKKIKKNYVIRRENKSELSLNGNMKENVVCINTKKGFIHSLAKFILSWKLATENNNFVTDVTFKNGKKSDIIDLDNSIAYNILNTNSIEETQPVQNSVYPVTVQPILAKTLIEQIKSYLPNSWSLNFSKKKKSKK